MTPWLIGFAIGGLAVSKQQVATFERGAAADIRSKLRGSGAHVHVKLDVGLEAAWGELASAQITGSRFEVDALPLFVEPKRSKRGWVHKLSLDLSDFTLNGLRVERLSANIPDCNFDMALAVREKKIRVTKSGTGTGEVVVLAGDLERFVLKKFREIKTVHMRLDRDKIWVEGHGDFLVFSSDFFIVASLEPVDGGKLALTHARIALNGEMANDAAKAALLEVLNPIVDLDRDLNLFGTVKVSSIKIRGGRLSASGSIQLPNLPTGATR